MGEMQGFPAGTDRAGHLCSVTLPLTTEASAQPYLLFSSFGVECYRVRVHKQKHLLTEEENLRTTQVSAFSGLFTDPIWAFSANINIV